MRNFFIFHGSYGHPGENWYPWLKQELESMGHRVFIPTFPIPKVKGEGHKLDLWFKAFGTTLSPQKWLRSIAGLLRRIDFTRKS